MRQNALLTEKFTGTKIGNLSGSPSPKKPEKGAKGEVNRRVLFRGSMDNLMTRLLPFQLLIANLRQELSQGDVGYMTKERAYERLKKETGQDFGYDAKAWKKWLKKNNLK